MKKSFVILTSILLMCIMLIGCAEGNITLNTSRDLNKNLNILSNAVKRLDTVDNDYLINDDLYAVEEISTESNKINGEKLSNITILANTDNVIQENEVTANQVALKDDLKEALKDDIISRLYCDENGNCKLCGETFVCDNDGTCNSCNKTIICDENGNCTTCGNTLYLNENNSCNSCNKSCVSSENCNSIPSNISDKLLRISSDNKELIADKLSYTNLDENNAVLQNEKIETKLNNNDNNMPYLTSEVNVIDKKMYATDNNMSSKSHNAKLKDLRNIDNYNTNNDNISVQNNDENFTNNNEDSEDKMTNENNENSPSVRIIYLSEQNFEPNTFGYSPRHIRNINSRALSNSLENYLNKVQKLYTMTADVVEANNDLLAKRSLILDTINETKALNQNIEKGVYTPTENQVDALKNYIIDIKATVKNIRNCNGELTNEINKISNENNGLSQSIDVISSNYLKILNQLDTRISYHDNAIATLEQIKNILEENYNNYIANQTPDSDIIVDNKNEDLNDNTNSDIIVDTPIIDDDNSEDNVENNPSDVIIEIPDDTNSETRVNDDSTTENNADNNPSQDNTASDTVDNNIVSDSSSNGSNTNTKTGDENNVASDDVIVENENNTFAETNDQSTILEYDDIANDTQNHDHLNAGSDENKIADNDTDETSSNKVDANLTNTSNDEITHDTVLENEIQNVDSGHIKSNIDTYQNSTLSYTNIDTLNRTSRNKEITNSSDNINSTEDNITNSTNTSDNVISNNNIGSTDNILNDNIANNDMIYNNGNLNNGNIYSNSIINDNNIGENDLGNISYRYDKNGHLYNNTNGFNSAGINNENINNNNINTYKYNTMVDTINRGTVNNGINTL